MSAPFRSIIKLVIKPGRNSEFESAFRAAGMLIRPKGIDSAFSGELLRDIDAPETYYVIAHWSSQDAYTTWQTTSRDGADADAKAVLDEVLVDPVPGRLFELIAAQ